MENILFNTNKNHSTNQIDVYNTERAFAAVGSIASSESVLSILYTSLRFVLFFYVHKLFTKVSIIFFAKMLTNNMVGAILIYERC